jgi:pimeloyl-ACP methyl ester carboxylesterase
VLNGARLIEPFTHGGATLVDEVLPGLNPANVTPANPAIPVNLVFLHGWRGTRDSLRGIATLFQHSHRVHLLDLPGFGDAPPPPLAWGTTEYADLVQHYLHDRAQGPVVLVGHSFGSRICIRLAARRLPQVRAVVLMAAPGLPAQGHSRASLRRWGIRALRKMLIAAKSVTGQRPIEWHTSRFGSKDYLAAGAMRSVLVRTVTEDLTDSTQAVNCPVMLLWGSDDTETPTWLGERYRELLGDRATLVVLPHKDHHSIYGGTGAHLSAFKISQWMGALADHQSAGDLWPAGPASA